MSFDNSLQQQEMFDVNNWFSLVQRFDPDKADSFFDMFVEWLKEQLVTLIQGKLPDKAKEAHVALDQHVIGAYDSVRTAVLKAFE